MGKQGIGMASLLTLGRQHFSIHPQELAADAKLGAIVGDNAELLSGDEAFAEPFFRALGFRTIESLDASDYESCSRMHDLNAPIPEEWHGQYDVVFDGGTLEHVFHFPNAIANAMNLVKQGGVLVSLSPSNNYNGHGFYQFSPELFFRVFCEANGFRVMLMALVESGGKKRIFRVDDPDRIGRRITFGGESKLQMLMVARRERSVPLFRESPFQSDYAATWNGSATSAPCQGREPGPTQPISLRKKLRRLLPSRWIYRYDCMRNANKHRKLSLGGVTQVGSIDECWLR